MKGRLRLQSWLQTPRILLVERCTLSALIGGGFLALNAWAQAPNPMEVAPPAPAIPMPADSSPLAQPSLAPLRPSSQGFDVTPSGPVVAPASTLISPAPVGPATPPAEGTTPTAVAPRPSGQVTIDSDLQQADQATGIITATGNVRIIYPDQRVVATARQAQYFTKEDRVVLSGDVDVIQEGGNHLRAERVIYLIKADRVMAEPAPGQQVFSKMVIQRKGAVPASAATTSPPPHSGPVAPGSVMATPTTGGAATVAPDGPGPLTNPRPSAPVTP